MNEPNKGLAYSFDKEFWNAYIALGGPVLIAAFNALRFFVGGPGSPVVFVMSGALGMKLAYTLGIRVTPDIAFPCQYASVGLLVLSWVVCTITHWKRCGFRFYEMVHSYILMVLTSLLAGYTLALS